MRILQLCNKPPFPPKDGGCIAMHNITRGLLDAGHEVKVMTIFTHKHDLELENLSEEYIASTDIEGVFVDTKVNLVDAFSSLITQDSYNVSRFFSADFDMKLTRLLRKKNFDIIHLESLFMTPYIGTIRRLSKAKIVLRSHNLEYIIWERVASGTKNLAKRAYLKYLSKKLKEYELSVIHDVDGIASISMSDERKYRDLGVQRPLINIPFGIDLKNYTPQPYSRGKVTLFHIGSMDWRPNLEGILWFIEDVWPQLHTAHPELELHLAGRGLSEDMLPEKMKKVMIHGEVEDAREFMADHSIMIVPLLSAGGIRVKIIEGMALGKAIVSTSIGAEGIDYSDGKNLVLADDANSFAAAIAALVSQPSEIQQIGQHARHLTVSDFDNQNLIAHLVKFYEQLVEEK